MRLTVEGAGAISIAELAQGARSLVAGLYGGRPADDELMAMDAGEIEQLISKALPDAEVTVTPLADDNDHYAAPWLPPPPSRARRRVQQHQMVYDALRGRMGGDLHALVAADGGKA